LSVFSALKETDLPDFVLNFTLAGFVTVSMASSRTFWLARFLILALFQKLGPA
jgi:hypothetical protein